jgi:hypothetical protein
MGFNSGFKGLMQMEKNTTNKIIDADPHML